ncbi:MAG: sigma-70 family RNA polymerase sigma factor [bacterium]|nr:sigma-70 family RNA polymerase sigma factor [bacterium]
MSTSSRVVEDLGDISVLLSRWNAGDEAAEERLLQVIYPQLRAIAAMRLDRNRRQITLQTSDLVQEAFVKLIAQHQADWKNRSHFFAIAARLMRRIVMDHARRHARGKRGNDPTRLSIDEVPLAALASGVKWLDLDLALEELTEIDATAGRVVEMRFFAGMTLEESAEALDVSRSTVVRNWRFARAWLERRLAEELPATQKVDGRA